MNVWRTTYGSDKVKKLECLRVTGSFVHFGPKQDFFDYAHSRQRCSEYDQHHLTELDAWQFLTQRNEAQANEYQALADEAKRGATRAAKEVRRLTGKGKR
jgi:hypothetical protein